MCGQSLGMPGTVITETAYLAVCSLGFEQSPLHTGFGWPDKHVLNFIYAEAVPVRAEDMR